MIERKAQIWFEGWAGRMSFPCLVVGETDQRYRIQATDKTISYGQWRLLPGETRLVPKRCITFVQEACRE